MSEIVSLELTDEQIARLDRAAQRARKTRTEMAATLPEEALRLSTFPFIEPKDPAVRREAFVAGTRLRIWRIAMLAREIDNAVAWMVEHWNLREAEAKAALAYAAAFPEEMEAAIGANDVSLEELKRILPNLEVITVDLTAADAPAP
jgi:hypothetical protein